VFIYTNYYFRSERKFIKGQICSIVYSEKYVSISSGYINRPNFSVITFLHISLFLKKMENFPSNQTWVPVSNCSCPIAENNCYRPELYSKPIICAHNSIPNILKFLERPVEFNCSIYFVYIILIAILGTQVIKIFFIYSKLKTIFF